MAQLGKCSDLMKYVVHLTCYKRQATLALSDIHGVTVAQLQKLLPDGAEWLTKYAGVHMCILGYGVHQQHFCFFMCVIVLDDATQSLFA